MKKILLSAIIGCSFLGNAFAVQADAEAGKTKAAICGACHGMDGNSLVPAYPKLAGQHPQYITKQLQDFKAALNTGGKEGRNDPIMGGMVAALTEQDMADISAFFTSQTISASTAKANPTGKKIYLGGDADRGITACIACHGNAGEGASLAGFPAVNSQNVEYLKIQLTKFRDASRNNDMNAMMRTIASKLNDDEIAALADYMSSL
ncbi:cytochrome c4 [Thalassotalea sp. 42_200_T64]|nr:cytochrome c4 [Thalassotalea sp. 42_200_T64]